MKKRDEFRKLQLVLGVKPTGIPNDETKEAFGRIWDEALSEYREGGQEPNPESGVVIIRPDGWIEGVRKETIPGGNAMTTRRLLVIHFTAGATGMSSVDGWRDAGGGVCAHIVIERNGEVIQCREFDRTCGHVGAAGKSRWSDPKTGAFFDGLNSCSIGIEIANAGDSDGALSWARKQPGFKSRKARHRNGGPETEWEEFYPPQISAVFALSAALVKAYKLDDVTGHDCVAPERRSDPGPLFPMEKLREFCGFNGLPVVHRK